MLQVALQVKNDCIFTLRKSDLRFTGVASHFRGKDLMESKALRMVWRVAFSHDDQDWGLRGFYCMFRKESLAGAGAQEAIVPLEPRPSYGEEPSRSLDLSNMLDLFCTAQLANFESLMLSVI